MGTVSGMYMCAAGLVIFVAAVIVSAFCIASGVKVNKLLK